MNEETKDTPASHFGPTGEYELQMDIGIKMDGWFTSHEGPNPDEYLNEFEQKYQLESPSSGAGWGVRDKQFVIPEGKSDEELLQICDDFLEGAKQRGLKVEHASYGYVPVYGDQGREVPDEETERYWDEANRRSSELNTRLQKLFNK